MQAIGKMPLRLLNQPGVRPAKSGYPGLEERRDSSYLDRSGIHGRALTPLFVLVVWLAVMPAGLALGRASELLDDFEELRGWTTRAAPGAKVEIARDLGRNGKALRIDFDFTRGGGFIIVQKRFALDLPEDYAFKFFLRAEGPRNTFELRLADPSDKNIWLHRKPELSLPGEWREFIVKKHQLQFAWGPAGGGAMKQVATVQFALSFDEGGKGSLWIDDLRFEPREPARPYALTPAVHASTEVPGGEAALALDPDPATRWRSGSIAEDQWLLIDFLKSREYGGLALDWDEQDYATNYQVQVSADGKTWTPAYTVTAGNGGRDYIYLPDAESRYLRLDLKRSSRQRGYGIRNIMVKPLEFGASPNQFFEAIARDSPRGSYPKYLSGEQSYWTLVGVGGHDGSGGDDKEALLNEEGMLEVDKRGFSLEPFLFANGELITWNDVKATQELERGYLPIPSVTWRHDELTLKITWLATGAPGAAVLYGRYRLENSGAQPQHASLFLAIRPFQVNPPWQSFNMVGGTAPINEIDVEGTTFWVNRDKAVVPLSLPLRMGAVTFDEGPMIDFLREDTVPPQAKVLDSFGYASGVLQYQFDLAPGAMQEVYVAVPMHDARRVVDASRGPELDSGAVWAQQHAEAVRFWDAEINRVAIQLPPGYEDIINTVRTTLAYILINRDGAAIRPGSRCYERSWIRDGALTSSALLEMGHTREVHDFISWYAGFQEADGKVPCCVDRWGGDPFEEHDSHGEFIYALMEYYRYTRDVGFLSEMWPHVVRAVDYMDSLRRRRLTDDYKTEDKLAYYGLLPESASHEGYAVHPVHSYWDDFWALRGLKDAASMAVVLGDTEQQSRFAALRDTFSGDLYASIARTLRERSIAYLPGSVELGDFDPTSTAIAVILDGEQHKLPQAALSRTFEIYRENFLKRQAGEMDWSSYSPYELRNVDALVRLGQREPAFEALKFFLKDRRPAAWNQWAEVVWRDPKAPRLIGDMPHTWIGSDYIRTVRSLFVSEREVDQSLVIGAGLPAEWVESAGGIKLKRLPTYYGVLNYEINSLGPGELRLSLSGDLAMPPGKIVLELPLPRPLASVLVNGKASSAFDSRRATIGEFPAEVILKF